ncbi:MAG: molybdopterin-synthase adenylyltransferase MoeB, partial [Actinomycetia bacterium]|nr:molybdopterin-synthase adenylyltransferase MoeB [Actinomycetes bacterium]
MSTYRELLEAARVRVEEIDVATVAGLVDESEVVLLDVREPDETAQGVLPGALTIPRGLLETTVESAIGDRRSRIVVYCATGVRSVFAANTLADLGYSNALSMSGGFDGWKSEGRAFQVPDRLSGSQMARYRRHTLLPEVGEDGQRRLLDSSVLLVGAGGLGSPAGLYLAAAGVGRIGVVDLDVVDESNLQRQVMHNTSRLGQRKVDSARLTLTQLNPDVEVVAIPEWLDGTNALEIVEGWDVIVDGADNFATRYLLNDVSVKLGIPVVHGSIFRFEGQVSVFDPKDGPTYRDLLPEPPPPEFAPNCAEAGVLGVLPGIIGSLQALEAIKVLLGLGDVLRGRLLAFDALDLSFREFRIPTDPRNEVTWANREHIELGDYT